jgi:DNA-binding NarL/FixJ family response regulator
MRTLTKKESEVSRLVSQGLTNKEIANDLRILETTVKSYLVKIYLKLNINNRSKLILWFHRNGL